MKSVVYQKKITIISPMHGIIIYFCMHRAMNDAQYIMTYFSLQSYSRVEVSCLTVSGEKKKKKRSVEEDSWKSLTWMMKHPWVHDSDSHRSQNTPSRCLQSSPDIDKLCPQLFFSLSLKLLNSMKMNKAIHRDYSAKKKKKLFTKTNKNQYIKTIFQARPKAYKNIH